MLDRLWRSTPFRLALALVGVFSCVSVASLAAAYLLIHDALEQNLQDSLQREMAGLRAAASAEALADLVASQDLSSKPEQILASFRLPSGATFGSPDLAGLESGAGSIVFAEPSDAEYDRPAPDGRYLVTTQRIQGGRLTLAISAEPLDDLWEVFVQVFVLSVLPTTVVALGGAVALAWRSDRKLVAIEVSLEQLASGNLASRVPSLPGRADDLSRVADGINRMAVAQEASTLALRQVSADIAHELRTPIQRVSVLLHRLQEAGLPPKAQDYADRASAETGELVATFQALLHIAQIEGGSPRARFAPVDLRDVAAKFAELYEPAAEDSGHRLVVDLTDDPAFIRGDKALLGQLVANLIENALAHTPRGTAVTLSLRASAVEVALEVSDIGPGIPEAERANVTKRLYRLESSRTTPGSGLGLSLVSAIASAHDAAFELSSNRPGLKASFRAKRMDPLTE